MRPCPPTIAGFCEADDDLVAEAAEPDLDAVEPDVRADVLGAGVIEPLEDDAAINADPVRVAIVLQEEDEGAGWGGGVAGSPW